MNVKNLSIKFAGVALLIAFAIYVLYPPTKKLKPGIDLAGGHSLLYEIDTSGLDPEQLAGLAERTIKQLRKRVDPNNQRNLVWRSIGDARIEIQMPSASGQARQLREARNAAISKVLSHDIPRENIEATLRLPADERAAALEQLAHGEANRIQLLSELNDRYTAYRAVKEGTAADSEVTEPAAYQAFDEALRKVLDTNITRTRLFDVLGLAAGAPRDQKIAELTARFPAQAAALAEAVPTYDAWSKDRGMLEDPEDLKRFLRGAGVLEFRIMAQRNASNPTLLDIVPQPVSDYVTQLAERGPRPKPGQPYAWFKLQDPISFLHAKDLDQFKATYKAQGNTIIEEYAGAYYVLAHAESQFGLLAQSESKWKLVKAIGTRDFNTGRPVVNFELDGRGGELFGRLTRESVGRPLGIFLDNECMSAPTIDEEIREFGVIRGDSFTLEDIHYLVNTLEAGSLPARLKEPPLSERSIGSQLGETNRSRGFKAALVGLVLVSLFMLVYYLLAGLIANVALGMNILLVLAAMAALEATFTLPGIAGLILTVGMAVDANVLIFERIREELNRGASLKIAVKTGYQKAFSTIFDANVTTLITSAILGYAGSEDVKGFAIVLGLGVVFSMFTALFVTRIIFAALIQGGIVKSLPMLRFIGNTDVQWVGMVRTFWPVSLAAVILGGTLFLYENSVHKDNIYDIEFLGGTAVTVEFKPDAALGDEEVRARINGSGPNDADPGSAAGWLRYAANNLGTITVTPSPQAGVFDLASPTFSATQLETLAGAAMVDVLEPLQRGGLEQLNARTLRIAVRSEFSYDAAKVRQRFEESATGLRDAAGRLLTAKVGAVWDSLEARGEQPPLDFDITTTETNKDLVRQAIVAALGDRLRIQRPVEYVLHQDPVRAPGGFYPLHSDDPNFSGRLADIIGEDTLADTSGFRGGVALVFDEINPPQTEAELRDRLHNARLLPEFEQYTYRPFLVTPLEFAPGDLGKPADQRRLARFALLVADETVIYEDDPELWERTLAAPELEQARTALGSSKSLQRVQQFAPQIARQMTQQAIMAILLALIAIVLYIWARFGEMQFGLAAIVALVHDVVLTLGLVSLSYYVYALLGDNILLIQDFKIDLPMIAALLTIVGYSLNDTIVVFDRIRENRGKLKDLGPAMVNLSINQTLSRTILTSGTTLVAVVVMYIGGGEGIHGFSFAMTAGIVVGTYSSIAVAAPLLLYPRVLKWIMLTIVALILVGLALSLAQRELQVLVWIVTAIFAIAVIYTHVRQPARAPGKQLATGATQRLA